MQTKNKNRHIVWFFCIALIVAVALMATGCTRSGESDTTPAAETVIQNDGESLGTGRISFTLTVTDADGNEIRAEIHTDKETVGEALKELGIIAGEESPTGLYVKTVNGITADYDEDRTYWAFYVNDTRAQAGVDAITITEGDHYAFKVEKA